MILTNRKDQKIGSAMERGHGSLNQLEQGIAQWLPRVPANTPISERWRSSFYVTDTPIGKLAEWRLVLEQPVAPFQKVLYARYTEQLVLLLLVLLSSLVLAEFLIRKIAAKTEQLASFATLLPLDIGMCIQPVWPESHLTEYAQLIGKFKEMAGSLAAQFKDNRRLRDTLEELVVQRTLAFANSERKYRLLIESSHDIIYTLNRDGVFTFVSKAWTALLGHKISEVVGRPLMPFVHPDDLARCMASMEEVFQGGQAQFNIEYRVLHVNGSWRWHTSNAVPLRDAVGTVIGYEGIASDITERKLTDCLLYTSRCV